MNLSQVGAELALCGWILVMLIADLIVPTGRKSLLWLVALAGLALTAGLLVWQQTSIVEPVSQGMFVADQFAGYFKGLFLATIAVVVVMTREFQRHLPANLGAFYMLLFTALLGMFVLASMNDMVLLFLGLELLTFSAYVMVAYLKRDPRAVEAGLKYLVLGSVSSGFLVYGLALLYGFAGSTSFPVIRAACFTGAISPAAHAGVFLVLAGLGFKVAAVPFHWWVPDVYEGAPTPVVAMLSVGSKMAGVVALLRVCFDVFWPLSHLWAPTLALLSAATLLYGNLAAIPQLNMKRLLGYSSIGHAGYLLMGLSTASVEGVHAVGYYLLAYLLSNLAVFLVVVASSDAVGGEALECYNGLSKRSPVLAATLFIGLLSLAGVPPLAGFVGKLLILLATMESRQLWLVTLGAVNVVISLYYYLMVVKRMYFNAPATAAPIDVTAPTKLTLSLLSLGILAVGIFQEPFVRYIRQTLHP